MGNRTLQIAHCAKRIHRHTLTEDRLVCKHETGGSGLKGMITPYLQRLLMPTGTHIGPPGINEPGRASIPEDSMWAVLLIE
ncbi:MAG: hypothetical protein D8M59_00310 [Planctomycetes bacterium]|nr:hypothetical protein [Planctomycetota bacterium]